MKPLNRLAFFMFTGAAMLLTVASLAQTYTWTNATGNNLWNTAGNWSSSTPGTTPGASSAVIIASNNCILNTNVSVASIALSGTGQLTQGVYTISTSSDFTITGGTFNGGSATITIGGIYSQSGGTFTSTSNDLRLRGTAFNYISGIFLHNSGTVRMQPGFTGYTTIDLTCSTDPAFYNLRIDGGAGGLANINQNHNVLNSLTVTGVTSASAAINLKGNTIAVAGDYFFGTATVNAGNVQINNGTISLSGSTSSMYIYNTGTGISGGADGGTATIQFSGSGNQSLTSSVAASQGVLSNVLISKASGTLTMAGNINLSGNWIQTGGSVDPQTSTVMLVNGTVNSSLNINTSSMSFANLVINTYNTGQVVLLSNITLTGKLNIKSGATLNTNSPSFNISLGGDWVDSGTFSANSSTVTFNGTTNQNVFEASSFNNLTCNTSTSGSVTLGMLCKVNGHLQLTQGVIYSSSSSVLSMADNSTVSAGSNTTYVDGPMKKTGNDVFTFPLGKSGQYRPLGISAPSSVFDAFTAQFHYADVRPSTGSSISLPLIRISTSEYWTLDRSFGISNVSVTLSWNNSTYGSTGYVNSPTTVKVATWTGSQWVDSGGVSPSVAGTFGTITSQSAITDYPFLTLGAIDDLNPLPLELQSFTGTFVDESMAVEINWTVKWEKGNKEFEVQKSSDGLKFETLVKLNSLGDTSTPRHYSVSDRQPFHGNNYYKLKQTDRDGTEFTLKTINVISPKQAEGDAFVYPNPGNGEMFDFFNLNISNNNKVYVSIYNRDGILIQNREIDNAQNNAYLLHYEPTEALPQGTYIVKVKFGQTTRCFKYICTSR